MKATMLLDHEPVHAAVTHETTGAEYRVATALVLMNDAADDGGTTGWYWTRVPEKPTHDELVSTRRWREAVANRQGPCADAATALRAAACTSRGRDATARRLEQAAALIRGGELDATAAEIGRWLAEQPPAPVESAANAEPVLTDGELEQALYRALRATDERCFGNRDTAAGKSGGTNAA